MPRERKMLFETVQLFLRHQVSLGRQRLLKEKRTRMLKAAR